MLRFLRAGALSLACATFACGGEKTQGLKPAHATATPAIVHFGEVPVGSVVERAVTLANEGQAALVVSALRIAAGSDFRVGGASLTVEGHGSVQLAVRFQPSDAGARAARLEIESNADNGAVLQVTLDGTGTAPLVCDDCSSPPPPSCVGDGDLLVYEPAGTCVDGQCQYARRTVPCVAGCEAASAKCRDVPCAEGGAVRLSSDEGETGWPAVAWSGRSYGIAYEDAPASNRQIFFSRVSAGSALQGAPVALSTEGDSDLPDLAWGGDSFAVAFANSKSGHREVYFSRVNEDGTVALPATRVSSSGVDANLVSIAWAGPVRGEYGLAWQDMRDNMEVFFARVSANGDKASTEADVTNSPGAYSASSPSLVWNGSGYGLAWTDSRDGGDAQVYFERLTAEGQPVGVPTRVTLGTGTKSSPSLAWNGSKYGLLWTDQREGPFEAWFVELDDRGGKLGQEVRLSEQDGMAVHAHLAWGGGRWAATWAKTSGANLGTFLAVFPDPDHLGTPQRVAEATYASMFGPHVAFGPGQFAVTWQDYAGLPKADDFFRTICR